MLCGFLVFFAGFAGFTGFDGCFLLTNNSFRPPINLPFLNIIGK
jgi:hypothetical protein